MEMRKMGYQGRHSTASGGREKVPSAAPEQRTPEIHTPEQYTSERHAAEPVRGRKEGRTDRPKRRRAAKAQASQGAHAPKKSKWFRYFLLFYLAVLVVGSGFLQITLWRYLARSQAEMDRQEAVEAAQQAYEDSLHQAPQLAFETWLDGLSADYWTDIWCAKVSNALEDREWVRAYMEKLFAPDAVTAYKAAGFTQEAPVYVIKNGEQPLARVSLSGDTLSWAVTDVELLLEANHSASVTVAKGCRVTCNGKTLGEEYCQPAESLMTYEPLQGLLTKPVVWVTYSVEDLLSEPELTVTPPDGLGVTQDDDGNYLLLAGGNTSEYTERSVKYVRAFLNYYMNGYNGTWSNYNYVLSFLRSDTQAYKDIRDTYNSVSWATSYSDIDTSKTSAGDVIVWADNCFSVDVTYDADCTLLGEPVDYADATMRVYYLLVDGNFIISHFETL